MKKLLLFLTISLLFIQPVFGAFEQYDGTYTGDWNDNRSITGVGFEGDYIIVLPDDTEYTTHRTSVNAGDATQFHGRASADLTNIIQQFEADGFQLGSSTVANQNAIAYAYTVFTVDASQYYAGTYTGDTTDDRNITGVGFDPTYVTIKSGNYTGTARWLNESMGTNNSARHTSTANAANEIQDFISDGFQVGTGMNANGSVFYYHAFIDVTSGFDEGTYQGDGNDDRSITVGFQPTLVLIKADDTEPAVFSNEELHVASAGESKVALNGAAWNSNRIQDMEATGFQVGTDVDVNENGTTYYWAAWKEPAAAPVTGNKSQAITFMF